MCLHGCFFHLHVNLSGPWRSSCWGDRAPGGLLSPKRLLHFLLIWLITPLPRPRWSLAPVHQSNCERGWLQAVVLWRLYEGKRSQSTMAGTLIREYSSWFQDIFLFNWLNVYIIIEPRTRDNRGMIQSHHRDPRRVQGSLGSHKKLSAITSESNTAVCDAGCVENDKEGKEKISSCESIPYR